MKINKVNDMNTNFKNILVITNTRDNLGSHVALIKDVDDIKDENLKEMILNCLNKIDYENDEYWTSGDICGSDSGYVFNNFTLFEDKLPVTIEHIVNYVF
jgi:hypothetical protein